MQVESSTGFTAGKLQRLLIGLVVNFLLLPLPAFATISGFSWNSPVANGDMVFVGVDTSDTTSAIGVLKLTLATNTPKMLISQQTTWSITGHFNVTEAETLEGTWTGLNNISGINGSINVKVTLTGNSITNNMFGSSGTTYDNFNSPPSSQNLTTSESLPVFNGYTVTVLFTFTNGTAYTAASTPNQLILTLN